MLNKSACLASAASLLMCFSINSSAALVVKDLITAGDGFITLDTTTNLEWLDPYLMQFKTPESVKEIIASNPSLKGFKFATYDDFFALLPGILPDSIGRPGYYEETGEIGNRITGVGPRDNSDEGRAAIEKFGVTSYSFSHCCGIDTTVRASGLILGADGLVGFASFNWLDGQVTEINAGILENEPITRPQYQLEGAWLVRQVPEPASLLLLGLGLLGLPLAKKRPA